MLLIYRNIILLQIKEKHATTSTSTNNIDNQVFILFTPQNAP